jgi:tetratricopeptide (TPR) repeat protein
MGGLLAITMWHVMRSSGLPSYEDGQPRAVYVSALQRALDRLNRRPGDARAARLAALCLTQLRFAREAEPYYAKARQAGLLGLDDLQARALGMTEINLLEEATTAYEEILKDHPDDPTALRRLAAVRISQARFREALPPAERLSRQPGQEVVGFALIGTVEHEQKHPDRAVAAFERVLSLDPELRRLPLPLDIFWTYFAEDLIDSGQPAKARRILSRVLSRREDPVQMNLLGLAFQSEGRNEEAERWFRKAVELDPTLSRGWLHLGRLLMQPPGNRWDEAIPYLKRAAELSPKSFEPLYSLSMVYRYLRKKDEADRYRKLADQLRPAQPPNGGMDATSSPQP